MVHLSKLSVGIRDIAHLRAVQASRQAAEGAVQHRTRMMPRRMEELTDGGSIYWIIGGVMSVRQRLLQVHQGVREDGASCAVLVLDPPLVEVAPRAVRPFQGWRYLRAEDAPADADLTHGNAPDLPPALRRELCRLALL